MKPNELKEIRKGMEARQKDLAAVLGVPVRNLSKLGTTGRKPGTPPNTGRAKKRPRGRDWRSDLAANSIAKGGAGGPEAQSDNQR